MIVLILKPKCQASVQDQRVYRLLVPNRFTRFHCLSRESIYTGNRMSEWQVG